MPSTMSGTMLAVVKPEAAPGAEIREFQIPSFGPADVLVKVKSAAHSGARILR
jgi:threonine 3-dehydrogenase